MLVNKVGNHNQYYTYIDFDTIVRKNFVNKLSADFDVYLDEGHSYYVVIELDRIDLCTLSIYSSVKHNFVVSMCFSRKVVLRDNDFRFLINNACHINELVSFINKIYVGNAILKKE